MPEHVSDDISGFYTLVLPRFRRYCRSIAGEALGDDLCQDVLLRALTDVVFAELDDRQKQAWLCRTARNLLIDRVRRAAREQNKLALLYCGEEDTDPYAEVETAALLALLPPEKQLIFRLRYLEGYTAREIAELLDKKPSTVRGELMAARNDLRSLLQDSEKENIP